jgi:hypothetical protein
MERLILTASATALSKAPKTEKVRPLEYPKETMKTRGYSMEIQKAGQTLPTEG